MSSSTIITQPIDIYKNHLFHGDRTFLLRDDQAGKDMSRGASHHTEGAQPGDISYILYQDKQEYDDLVSIFSPVNDSDRANSQLTGSKATDQAILAQRFNDPVPMLTVDGNKLTLHSGLEDFRGDHVPPLEHPWLRDIETAMGQPFERDQVDDLDHITVGIGLVGHTSTPENLKMERVALYQMSQASEKISGSYDIKELDGTCDQLCD